MTYIIAQPCVDLKDRACVEVCPVDCIYEGNRMLYIHPDECVDCGACEPQCPVKAIYEDRDAERKPHEIVAPARAVGQRVERGHDRDDENARRHERPRPAREDIATEGAGKPPREQRREDRALDDRGDRRRPREPRLTERREDEPEVHFMQMEAVSAEYTMSAAVIRQMWRQWRSKQVKYAGWTMTDFDKCLNGNPIS